MAEITQRDTLRTYNELITNWQGGGFVVQPTATVGDTPWIDAIVRSSDLKPFTLSIYNQDQNTDWLSMAFMINPSDIAIGQTYVASDTYTREGWLSTLWGKNLMTINANCSTAGFYVYIGDRANQQPYGGVTEVFRKDTMAFKNFIAFLGIFKNGAYYYLRGDTNKGMFREDPGRVISVMDQTKISYDDNDYIGSFNSLTIDESVETPFSIRFNFEFVISGLRGEETHGHLRICDEAGCNNLSDVKVNIQGTYSFEDTVVLNEGVLADTFKTADPLSLPRLPTNVVDNYQEVQARTYRRFGELSISTASRLPKQSTIDKVLGYYDQIEAAVDKYGLREYGIEPWVLAAQMAQESGGVPNAKSHAGAAGLMQIMPATGKELGLTTAADFNDPDKSIDAGARYLRDQVKATGSIELGLAAYNAGLGNVQKYGGLPPFEETIGYVARINNMRPVFQKEWAKETQRRARQ